MPRIFVARCARERGVEPDEVGRLESRRRFRRAFARSGRAARPPSAPAHRRARPAAARRDRRRPGPSGRPGSRAGRRARCPRARAATADWANENRAAPRSARRSIAVLQRFAPQRDEVGARRVGDRDAEPRQIPVEQQLDLDQKGVDVVGRQRVHRRAARPASRSAASGCAARPARRPPRHSAPRSAPADRRTPPASLPRSSMMQQAVGEARPRRSAAPRSRAARSPFAIATNGIDVLGQMRDRAVGLAVAHRRPVRPARRVHQDGALLAVRAAARRSASRRRPGCAARSAWP